jgi:hypothetical protein
MDDVLRLTGSDFENRAQLQANLRAALNVLDPKLTEYVTRLVPEAVAFSPPNPPDTGGSAPDGSTPRQGNTQAAQQSPSVAQKKFLKPFDQAQVVAMSPAGVPSHRKPRFKERQRRKNRRMRVLLTRPRGARSRLFTTQ